MMVADATILSPTNIRTLDEIGRDAMNSSSHPPAAVVEVPAETPLTTVENIAVIPEQVRISSREAIEHHA